MEDDPLDLTGSEKATDAYRFLLTHGCVQENLPLVEVKSQQVK